MSWEIGTATEPQAATVDQAVPPPTVASTGKCLVNLKYDSTATSPTLSGSFMCSGLTSNITASHIHALDVATDTLVAGTGGPLFVLTAGADPTQPVTFSGIAAADISPICNDRAYVNIHTSSNGGGEVRLNLAGFASICATGKSLSPVNYGDLTPLGGAAPPAGQVPSWTLYVPLTSGAGTCYTFLTYETGAPGSLNLAGLCLGLTAGGKITSISISQNYTTPVNLDFVKGASIPSNGVPFSYTVPLPDSATLTQLCNTKGAAAGSRYQIDAITDKGENVNAEVTFNAPCPAATPTITPTAPVQLAGFTNSFTALLFVFLTLISFIW